MTIIELFSWLLALCVMMASVTLLKQFAVPSVWASIIGFVLGIVSWVTCVYGGQRLVSWLEQRKAKKKPKRDK